MRHRLMIAFVCIALFVSIFSTSAQDAEPTTTPVYDPTCVVDLMKAYMSGWEYHHRGSEGEIDMVVAAQVARGVYTALNATQPDCQDALSNFKRALLRSMHGEYPPDDLARLIGFVDEAVGSIDYNDCSYSLTNQFVQRVDWGTTSAVEIGRSVSEIVRAVRDVIPSGECNGTFQIIQEILSHIDKIPPDGTLISTLYKVVGDATENHYVTEGSCDYTLAKTFLGKVQWDGLDSAHIVSLVSDTFKITYKISSDGTCDSDPALAITAMLLDDTYRFSPDAIVIQNSYDAASGKVVVTPEATVIVN